MRSFVTLVFWCLYSPLIRLFTILLFWNAKVQERERFEKRNKFESLAQSFREMNLVADLCFEFSSEGEYQQVAPLIADALKQGKKLELVFFSPSVEKTIIHLAKDFPDKIRYLRYPLVRFFPFMGWRCFSSWVTAKKLIMVRYDLFPEFLLWSMKKDNHLKIIWVTFKKERSKGIRPSFWKRLFLKYAEGIVYAGEPDLQDGLQMGFPGKVFDFRIEQIKRRVLERLEKYQKVFSIYSDFKSQIDQSPAGKRLILGNAWPSDLFLLRDLPKDVQLVIVPHQLNAEILGLFREGLDNLGREVFEVNDQTENLGNSSTILINKKGILCELYADFQHAYVGGGFEGSIHSVLEPLVAGNGAIACGPFHHRSTEYDIALGLGRITEVNTPEQFLAWLNNDSKNYQHGRMDSLVQDYESLREFVISC